VSKSVIVLCPTKAKESFDRNTTQGDNLSVKYRNFNYIIYINLVYGTGAHPELFNWGGLTLGLFKTHVSFKKKYVAKTMS
jgi:hypothetical protein